MRLTKKALLSLRCPTVLTHVNDINDAIARGMC